jgi:hypothetical protein
MAMRLKGNHREQIRDSHVSTIARTSAVVPRFLWSSAGLNVCQMAWN